MCTAAECTCIVGKYRFTVADHLVALGVGEYRFLDYLGTSGISRPTLGCNLLVDIYLHF